MTLLQFELDVEEVWKEMKAIISRVVDHTSGMDDDDDGMDPFADCILPCHAREVCRYAGEETHVVGAILGGIASQEAVKLLTHQYVCINNTFVYNGVAGVGSVYDL